MYGRMKSTSVFMVKISGFCLTTVADSKIKSAGMSGYEVIERIAQKMHGSSIYNNVPDDYFLKQKKFWQLRAVSLY